MSTEFGGYGIPELPDRQKSDGWKFNSARSPQDFVSDAPEVSTTWHITYANSKTNTFVVGSGATAEEAQEDAIKQMAG